jgi:peptidoglycan-N-acetylglucosamine deacetylase
MAITRLPRPAVAYALVAVVTAAATYCLARSPDRADVFRIENDSAQIAQIVRSGRSGEIPFIEDLLRPKPILLTFDDGPQDSVIDRQILAILARHHAHAIWFVNCNKLDPALASDAAANRAVLKEIVAQGHQVGNHSYNHYDLAALEAKNPQQLDHEIGDCSDMIESISGVRPRYFAPPFGISTPHVKDIVERNGMHVVLRTNNSYDSMLHAFRRDVRLYSWYLEHNPAFDFVGHTGAGDIILMHDFANTRFVLDRSLTALENRGFVFAIPQQASATHAQTAQTFLVSQARSQPPVAQALGLAHPDSETPTP